MNSLDKDQIRYTNRWFAYFDLLGFSELVQSKSIEQVMPIYQSALDHLLSSNSQKRSKGVYVSWFSDTFIIYSRGGQAEDFANIEHVSRIFFQQLILNQVPVRGSLTYGKLYSQQEQNIFVGPALIDAHHYGEGVNWLGFVLTPKAIERLEEVELPINERAFYRQISDRNVLKKGVEGKIAGFAFNNGLVGNKNPYIESLIKMRNHTPEKYQDKYDNALDFISAHSG